MKIVLIRHGKPKIDKNGKVNAREFGQWVSEYNLAGIDLTHQPPADALDKAKQRYSPLGIATATSFK